MNLVHIDPIGIDDLGAVETWQEREKREQRNTVLVWLGIIALGIACWAGVLAVVLGMIR